MTDRLAITSLEFFGIALAAAIGLAGLLLLGPMLRRAGVLDVPNHRSSHDRPTLRGGGSASAVALAVGFALAIVAVGLGADGRTELIIALGALAAAAVGLSDDLRPERQTVAVRAGLQLLIGALVSVALGIHFAAAWWAVVLGLVGFAAYVNMANFMDGINAISSLHGLVVGLSFAGMGVLAGQHWLVVSGLLIAIAFGTFLPWNLVPPGVFLGDVGSYLLGGSIAATAIAAAFAGLPAVAVFAPLTVYLADTLATLVRRSARGEPILSAHRTHAYQRLTDTGLSHVAVASLVAGLTVVAALIGLLTLANGLDGLLAFGCLLVLSAGYLLLPRLRGSVLPSPSNAQLVPVVDPGRVAARPGFAPRRWAVLGASGFIGSAVATDLREVGREVLCLPAPRLQLDPASADGAEVAAQAAAEESVRDLAAALRGVDVVVNAAGMAAPDTAATAELYGANALLPAVVARAAAAAGVTRVVHLSSAAVQGRRQVLDETMDVSPFSPYSRSKALGERALAACAGELPELDLLTIRATSVQGRGRPTTVSLRRVARSPIASVAAPGTQPTVVSSLSGLVAFVTRVGSSTDELPAIVLQPWEGLSVSDVLRLAGGREPRRLPAGLCKAIIAVGRAAGRVVPELAGLVRRVELMWFGQGQVPSAPGPEPSDPSALEDVLREADDSSEVRS
jgi:UDP-N-acetylmuramyl pentapeptide phosphotransferase/UDP-N-acetylglucosamine-1-phosphate transferase/dTDP-4-dehydrorhamnose reductase